MLNNEIALLKNELKSAASSTSTRKDEERHEKKLQNYQMVKMM